jgi:hypothetical protein
MVVAGAAKTGPRPQRRDCVCLGNCGRTERHGPGAACQRRPGSSGGARVRGRGETVLRGASDPAPTVVGESSSRAVSASGRQQFLGSAAVRF